ncbi:lipase family protein [Nocardia sp. CA-128927]|uniref:lipase family protein n=1 Tax=Nocardia sp. CA-128927 TaxID=3239975 RepID=UPI003D962535
MTERHAHRSSSNAFPCCAESEDDMSFLPVGSIAARRFTWAEARRTLVIPIAGIVCAASVWVGISAHAAPPDNDSFYDPPAALADITNGQIIRQRDTTIAQGGIPIPGLRGTQLLYKTTDSAGRPIATATTILIPPDVRPGAPLLSYQFFVNGLDASCNPSRQLTGGMVMTFPNDLASALARGWVVAVPDFGGPSVAINAYRLSGQAVLDGIRAAESAENVRLSGPRTDVVLMGSSGGGYGSLTAAELQPTYAPELSIRGVAAAEPPTDFEKVLRNLDGAPFFGNAVIMLLELVREYPQIDLRQFLNPEGVSMYNELQGTCLLEDLARFAFHRISDYSSVPDLYSEPTISTMLAENRLGQQRPAIPVYLEQGVLDEVVPPGQSAQLADRYCSMGAVVRQVTSFRGDHNTTGILWSNDAMNYLQNRLDGQAPPTSCHP